MKRLIFCFDGSWNRIDTPNPTNVLFTAESVLPQINEGISQYIFYDEGVGTESGQMFRGGLFGAGLVKNLADGYRFLVFNYTPGDEIFVFGFSRGAYTARSFVGLLGKSGIFSRRYVGLIDKAIEFYKSEQSEENRFKFRAKYSPQIFISEEEREWRSNKPPNSALDKSSRLKIQYLGVWDTVGALGIPKYLLGAGAANKKYQFHNVKLSNIVNFARHAIAIDEQKRDFEPTLWEKIDELNTARGHNGMAEAAPIQQVWFPGVHGSVGGGGERRGLSDQALDWIWDGARQAGLELDTGPLSRIYELLPSHLEHVDNVPNKPGFDLISSLMKFAPKKHRAPGPTSLSGVSTSAIRRWHEKPENLPEGVTYRPKTLKQVELSIDKLTQKQLGKVVDLNAHEFKFYSVRPGDGLRRISLKHLGDADRATEIFDLNRDKMFHPDRIYVGQILRIPTM